MLLTIDFTYLPKNAKFTFFIILKTKLSKQTFQILKLHENVQYLSFNGLCTSYRVRVVFSMVGILVYENNW